MNHININWNNIRSINGEKSKGFEEFVCQVIKKEHSENPSKFISMGNPDGGLDCFYIGDDSTIVGWQAKYFTKAFKDTQWNQIEKSIKKALESYSNLTKMVIVVACNPTYKMLDKCEDKIELWKNKFNINRESKIEFMWASDLIEIISKPGYEGFLKFWFNNLELNDEWFTDKLKYSLIDFKDKLDTNIIIETEHDQYFNFLNRNDNSKETFQNNVNLYLDSLDSSLNQFYKYMQKIDLLKSGNYLIGLCKDLLTLFNFIEQKTSNFNFNSIEPFDFSFKDILSTYHEFLDSFTDKLIKIDKSKILNDKIIHNCELFMSEIYFYSMFLNERDELFKNHDNNCDKNGLFFEYNQVYLESLSEFYDINVGIIECIYLPNYNDFYEEFKIVFDEFLNKIMNIPHCYDKINDLDFKTFFNKYYGLLNRLIEISESFFEPEYMKKFIKSSHKLSSLMEDFTSYLETNEVKLLNNPYLMIYGESGSGKSFLLGNIVKNKLKYGMKNVILLSGEKFTNINTNPEKIILDELDINNYNFTDFLDALECKAYCDKCRVIIIIDAINEGAGIELWKKYFNGFISKFMDKTGIGLVLSIRDTYLNQLNEDNIKKLKIPSEFDALLVQYKIDGFQYCYDAQIKFFDYYNISFPNGYLLSPELNNPLFLTILCESLQKNGYTTIPKGLNGFSKVIELYMDAMDNKLSNNFGYNKDSGLVELVLTELIHLKLKNNCISINGANECICEVLKHYNFNYKFLDGLAGEGVLTFNSDKTIKFTYQRLDDYFTAKFLLSKYNSNDLKQQLSKNGSLYKYLDKDSNEYNNQLLEMFSIYIPENFGLELYELVDADLRSDFDIISSFISSLKWRNKSFNENIWDYIENFIFNNSETSEMFLDKLILLAPDENHFLNAYKTHQILFNMSLPDRDYFWTEFINYETFMKTHLSQLLTFSFLNTNSDYSKETIKLVSIMLTWFLTSTNMELRYKTITGLVNILKDKISLLIELLKYFENVNDPYIYEGLYSVAYGCTLLTDDLNSLCDLVNYVYDTIFNQKIIYSNILLRGHARNIVEYGLIKNLNLKYDSELIKNKVRPPYSSNFPEIPSDKEIDQFKSKNFIIKSIFSSITGEFKEDNQRDSFGCYTFLSLFSRLERYLSSVGIGYNDLRNILIKRIFDLGYDLNKYEVFDEGVLYDCTDYYIRPFFEKYRSIAFYELLSQVTDLFNIQYENMMFGNNLQLLKLWDASMRKFDPTVLPTKQTMFGIDVSIFNNFYDEFNESSEDIDDKLNNIKNILNPKMDTFDGKFNGLVLESHFQKESKYDGWRHDIKSYIVSEDDFDVVINFLKNKNLFTSIFLEENWCLNVFNREFYQSRVFNRYYEFNRCNERIIEINEKHYVLEQTSLLNKSIEKLVNYDSFLKLDKKLFDQLNLKYGKFNTFLYSSTGEVVSFDTLEVGSNSNNLIIDKDILIDYLEENNLKIIFCVNIIDPSLKKYSGTYYLENNEIIGGINLFSDFSFGYLFSDFLGDVEDADINSKISGEYYIDKKNLISYLFFNMDDINKCSEFKNKQLIIENKKYHNLRWDIYFLSQTEKINNEHYNFVKKNLNNYGNSYLLFTTFENEGYGIVVNSGKFNITPNLKSKIFRIYIKSLLEQMNLSWCDYYMDDDEYEVWNYSERLWDSLKNNGTSE